MKLLSVLGIIFLGILITLVEWPRIGKDQKKEKIAFVLLTVVGIILATLLVYFPEMPGPTQMVEGMLKPLGKLLEK
ncbi:hypothetical protein [Oceanobacillus senegalensis]|uniref:hypothetical protein n=1 Tax=Oceanobacillus senegalensis TaxID=1936063 RepID=UPI000A312902|nr:hypothetical protein [Oceanobacillus senegalensis]